MTKHHDWHLILVHHSANAIPGRGELTFILASFLYSRRKWRHIVYLYLLYVNKSAHEYAIYTFFYLQLPLPSPQLLQIGDSITFTKTFTKDHGYSDCQSFKSVYQIVKCLFTTCKVTPPTLDVLCRHLLHFSKLLTKIWDLALDQLGDAITLWYLHLLSWACCPWCTFVSV